MVVAFLVIQNVTINDIYKADGRQGFGYTGDDVAAWE